MNIKQLCGQAFFTAFFGATLAFSQTIPDDPNHLPKKIGGDDRVDSIIVSGKVILDGLPSGGAKPTIYIDLFKISKFLQFIGVISGYHLYCGCPLPDGGADR